MPNRPVFPGRFPDASCINRDHGPARRHALNWHYPEVFNPGEHQRLTAAIALPQESLARPAEKFDVCRRGLLELLLLWAAADYPEWEPK